jgi:hypothetical protein
MSRARAGIRIQTGGTARETAFIAGNARPAGSRARGGKR